MRSASVRNADKRLLLVTACVVAIGLFALSVPDGVAFSSFFVIPFLILFPAPTAAFYLALFTASYFVVGRRRRILGAAFGLALVAVVAAGLPKLINLQIARDRREMLAADRPPARPVVPRGIVGIVTERPRGDGGGCSRLCLALLYSGSAAGVAEGRTLDEFTLGSRRVIWALRSRGQPCPLPEAGEDDGMRFNRYPDRRTMAGRALAGDCVIAHSGRLDSSTLIFQHEKLPDRAERTTLWRLEAGGRPIILARNTLGAPRRLFVPLFLSLEGSPVSGAHWTWARKAEPGAGRASVEDFIALDSSLIRAATPDRLRASLDSWLDRPDIRDPRIDNQIYAAVLPLMRGETREPGDFARYLRLLADPRRGVEDFEYAMTAFPERAPELGELALRRALSLTPGSSDFHRLNALIEDFPPGTFAHPSASMLAMIRRPEHARMSSLIARLADAGPSAAPMLLQLLRSGTPALSGSSQADTDTARAALTGLCRLGPAIPPAYEAVEREVQSNEDLNEYLAHTAWWAAVRVRLGRPPSTIEPPPKAGQGWLDDYRRRVEKPDCDF
jgi:hypothetical protein